MNNQPPLRRSPDNPNSDLTDLLVGYHEFLIDQSRVTHPQSDPFAADEAVSSVSGDDAHIETPVDRAVSTPHFAEIAEPSPIDDPCPQDSSPMLDDDRIDELIELEGCLRLLENVRRTSGLVSEAHSKIKDSGDTASLTSSPGIVSVAKSISAPIDKIRIGRFEIIREIGRGGLGMVFLAHDPVLRRKVALKLPRGDAFLSVDHIRRFRREAEAAARLTHPHIVPVYEIGEAGPFTYIASEYVTGASLAKWLSLQTQPTSIQLAARIVADLAGAMHYAHGQGVLHRDLKPSNILVETDPESGERTVARLIEPGERVLHPETVPVVKITDFGLAKLLDHADDQTRSGAILGTPAYMSPEQAEARSADLGSATDIYSLGVILYELLLRRTPHRAESDAATLLLITQGKINPLRAERSDIPADLQAICMKCLEHKPEQRYATAGELENDLRRFLFGEATLARPLTAGQRLGRWTARNPLLAALAASLLLALISIATISTIAALRIRTARDEARMAAVTEREARERADRALLAEQAAARKAFAAESRATQAKIIAEQTSALLVELFNTADPFGFASLGLRSGDEVGMDLPLSELLARGAEQARRSLEDQPLVLATMLDTLGKVYCNLGQAGQAEPLLQDAFDLRQQNKASEADLAASQLSLGKLRDLQGRFEESEPLLRQALETRTRLYGEDDLRVADTSYALAWLLLERWHTQGKGITTRIEEIQTLLERVYQVRLAELGEFHREVGHTLTVLAMCRFWQSDLPGATQLLLDSAHSFSRQEGGDRLMLAFTNMTQGMVLRKNGDLPGAIETYRNVLNTVRELLGEKHFLTGIVMAELAGALLQSGQVVESEAIGREIVKASNEIYPQGHPLLGPALGQLDLWAESRGDVADAETFRRQRLSVDALNHGTDVLRHEPMNYVPLRIIAGQFEEASRLLKEHCVSPEDVAAGRATTGYSDHWNSCAAELAHCLGDLPQAEQLLRKCSASSLVVAPKLQLAQVIFDQRPDDPEVASILDVVITGLHPEYPSYTWDPILLARLQLHQGRVDEAQSTIRPVLEFLRRQSTPGNWNLGYAENTMGLVLAAQGKNEEAESLLKSALANLRKSRGEHHWLTRHAATALVNFYHEAKRDADAEQYESLLQPMVLAHGP